MRRLLWFVAAIALVSGSALIATTASAATGTWTKITSPKGPGQAIYDMPTPGNPTATRKTYNISGTTSADVTSVDIYCYWDSDRQKTAAIASSVPAAAHTFSTSVQIPSFGQPCVLRAVPGGTTPGYVAAFTGPTFYSGYILDYLTNSNTIKICNDVGYDLPNANDLMSCPDFDGIYGATPWDDFAKPGTSPDAAGDELALFDFNVTQSNTPTASEIRVDGKNTYQPYTLGKATTGLAANQANVPAMTATIKRSATSGRGTVVMNLPLRSCSGSYPTTAATCNPANVGLVLTRTYMTDNLGAVIHVSDRFRSTDGHTHNLAIEYFNTISQQSNGNAGVRLPGQSAFHTAAPNTTVTNLPQGAHTIFMTTDFRATDGTPNRADSGITYSAKPKSLYFGAATRFGLRYQRTVPAGGSVLFSFSYEVGNSMTFVGKLATAQQKALTPHLTITSPASGASVGTAKIKGKVTNAVNGLPAKVNVTVGNTTKHVTVSASGTWTASFALANGKYTAKAVATDPGGVVLRDSVTFRKT